MREGDALEPLVTRCVEDLSSPVFRYVRGYVRDVPAARELTQEVFVRLCTEPAAGRTTPAAREEVTRRGPTASGPP